MQRVDTPVSSRRRGVAVFACPLESGRSKTASPLLATAAGQSPEEELENRVALWQKTKLGSYSGWEGYQRCWTTDGLHPEGPAPPAKLSPLGEKLLGTRPWK